MLREIEQAPRAPMPHLPLEQRRTTFAEVELGFTPGGRAPRIPAVPGLRLRQGDPLPAARAGHRVRRGPGAVRRPAPPLHARHLASRHHLRAGQVHPVRGLCGSGAAGGRGRGLGVLRPRLPSWRGRALRPADGGGAAHVGPPGRRGLSRPAPSCSRAPAAPAAAGREQAIGKNQMARRSPFL